MLGRSVRLADDGKPFILGQANSAGKQVSALVATLTGPVLKLTNKGAGAALQLQVAAGAPPIKVNAVAGRAINLDADKLDGRDASQIGVNGVELVSKRGADNSTSSKSVQVNCPAGKIAVGGGGRIVGTVTNIAIHESRQHYGDPSAWLLSAHEVNSTADSWVIDADAVCVLAGTP